MASAPPPGPGGALIVLKPRPRSAARSSSSSSAAGTAVAKPRPKRLTHRAELPLPPPKRIMADAEACDRAADLLGVVAERASKQSYLSLLPKDIAHYVLGHYLVPAMSAPGIVKQPVMAERRTAIGTTFMDRVQTVDKLTPSCEVLVRRTKSTVPRMFIDNTSTILMDCRRQRICVVTFMGTPYEIHRCYNATVELTRRLKWWGQRHAKCTLTGLVFYDCRRAACVCRADGSVMSYVGDEDDCKIGVESSLSPKRDAYFNALPPHWEGKLGKPLPKTLPAWCVPRSRSDDRDVCMWTRFFREPSECVPFRRNYFAIVQQSDLSPGALLQGESSFCLLGYEHEADSVCVVEATVRVLSLTGDRRTGFLRGVLHDPDGNICIVSTSLRAQTAASGANEHTTVIHGLWLAFPRLNEIKRLHYALKQPALERIDAAIDWRGRLCFVDDGQVICLA